MGEFRMPTLGADMTEGRITAWHVAPGDEVHHGDIVATVDTSKAEIDVEVFEDGVVERILVAVGEQVPVGTPLAVIAAPGTAVAPGEGAPAALTAPEHEAAAAPVRDGAAAAPPPAPVHRSAPAPPAPAGGEHRPRVSPLARRVAAELDLDPAALTGTGPHGSVVRADVERAAGAASAPATAPAPAAAKPPPAAAQAPAAQDRAAAMRSAIGALMARSKREIPHYHLRLDIDVHVAQAWVTRQNEGRPLPERLALAGVLLVATARAAAAYEDMNGFYADGAFQPADGVHLGVAISLRAGGLLTPAIRDADRLSVDDTMAALRDVVRRARSGGLRASELAAPTITVTDLGDRGVDLVHGVIYPPQVALVGFGAVRPRPWADGDALAVRPVVTATLAADHRVSDGHRGALFLREIDRLLQAPEDL